MKKWSSWTVAGWSGWVWRGMFWMEEGVCCARRHRHRDASHPQTGSEVLASLVVVDRVRRWVVCQDSS